MSDIRLYRFVLNESSTTPSSFQNVLTNNLEVLPESENAGIIDDALRGIEDFYRRYWDQPVDEALKRIHSEFFEWYFYSSPTGGSGLYYLYRRWGVTPSSIWRRFADDYILPRFAPFYYGGRWLPDPNSLPDEFWDGYYEENGWYVIPDEWIPAPVRLGWHIFPLSKNVKFIRQILGQEWGLFSRRYAERYPFREKWIEEEKRAYDFIRRLFRHHYDQRPGSIPEQPWFWEVVDPFFRSLQEVVDYAVSPWASISSSTHAGFLPAFFGNTMTPMRASMSTRLESNVRFSGFTREQHQSISDFFSQNGGFGNSNAWQPIWSNPNQETFGPGWVRRADGTIGWPTQRPAGVELPSSLPDNFLPLYGPFIPVSGA